MDTQHRIARLEARLTRMTVITVIAGCLALGLGLLQARQLMQPEATEIVLTGEDGTLTLTADGLVIADPDGTEIRIFASTISMVTAHEVEGIQQANEATLFADQLVLKEVRGDVRIDHRIGPAADSMRYVDETGRDFWTQSTVNELGLRLDLRSRTKDIESVFEAKVTPRTSSVVARSGEHPLAGSTGGRMMKTTIAAEQTYTGVSSETIAGDTGKEAMLLHQVTAMGTSPVGIEIRAQIEDTTTRIFDAMAAKPE